MDRCWVIRAGKESRFAEDFIADGIVAIGWSDLGEIDCGASKDDIVSRYMELFPEHSAGRAQTSASQIKRFLDEVDIGDKVVTYDRDQRLYFVGDILSAAEWHPEDLAEMPRVRKVQWTHQVSRDLLSQSTKNTLGAIQTLFLLKKKQVDEILQHAVPIGERIISPKVAPAAKANGTDEEVLAQLVEKAEETIEERIVRLDWEQAQALVAGILQAMGYRTNVSSRGADRGVDIFASPDGLGLEEPRIFVEVKHRSTTSIGAQDIRSFLGGRSVGDKCLYVSTGGFTKDARYEADRASVPLQLLGLVDLRRLYINYYEKLDEETRSLIPLKRIYVLAD